MLSLSPQDNKNRVKDVFALFDTDTVEDFEQWTKLGALKGVDGVWKLNEKFVCPSSARVELMSLYNGLAHAGPEKLHSMISKTWWWPKMKNS